MLPLNDGFDTVPLLVHTGWTADEVFLATILAWDFVVRKPRDGREVMFTKCQNAIFPRKFNNSLHIPWVIRVYLGELNEIPKHFILISQGEWFPLRAFD